MRAENRKMVTFRLDPHLLERVDRARGAQTRTGFLETALDRHLAEFEEFTPAPELGAEQGDAKCPVPDCEFSTPEPGKLCPWHNRPTR